MFLSTPFQLQPTLVGETLTLRPLALEDLEPLYEVARDPLLWEQHPQPERAERAGFETFFQSSLASGGALVAVENDGGRVVGSSRFYEWNPDVPDIAIGYSFVSRDLWGAGANTQMKALMLAHAFQWVPTVWFHVAKTNLRSRRAMEKIGGVFSHEAMKEFQGKSIPYVFYRIEAAR
ncbi:MAG TPA: GNAT family N-acetyltransferase [Fibrobacteria bacterium]|nr:GNAT family N-acetyltransferase [Fibrobacteria bacterium]